MMRACLDCHALTQRGPRCRDCSLARQRMRNQRPSRAIYRGSWPSESRAMRAEQPYCVVCGTDRDTTVDHTTGFTVCRSHHLSDKVGGVAESLRRWPTVAR